MLFIFAPLVAGVVCGFFLLNPKTGSIGGLLASIVAYLPLFSILEILLPRGDSALAILGAVTLLAIIGALGGVLGGVLSNRTTNR